MAVRPSALRFWINVFGAIVFAAHLALALMSYLQAPVLWPAAAFPLAAAVSASLGLQSLGLFAGNEAVIVSQAIALAIACIAAMTVTIMLTRRGDIDADAAQLMLRWSIAFAAANFLAYPLFTQDFWLSAAWG